MRSQLPSAIVGHLDRWATLCNAPWEVVGDERRGLSSSVVYPITLGKDRFALRNWDWSVERIEALRSKLEFQQRLTIGWSSGLLLESNSDVDCPIPLVIDRWADRNMIGIGDGTLWTLCTWRYGTPVSGTLSTPQFESIAKTLAKMHGDSLADGANTGKSPGWKDRLERLQSIPAVLGQRPSLETKSLADRTDTVVGEYVRAGSIQRLIDWVHAQTTTVQPACWIVRDSHQENWLFCGEAVSGFVDFGAARCEWPLWDVVRLLTSACCVQETKQHFLECYMSELPINHLTASVKKCAELLLDLRYWANMDFLQRLLSVMQWRLWSSQEQVWTEDRLLRWEALLEKLQAIGTL